MQPINPYLRLRDMVDSKVEIKWLLPLKYGFAIAGLTYLFLILKTHIYLKYSNWDIYAGVVAVLFLVIGVLISKAYFSTSLEKKKLPTTKLSKREAEVMSLLCTAKTNQQIADELCIELSTLKTHINRIYKKLEVKNRQQLMALVCS